MKKDGLKGLDRIIVYSVFIIPVLVLFSYAFWSMINSESHEDYFRKRDLAENFNGRIDSIYTDERNHNVTTALISDSSKFVIFPTWIHLFQNGDSVLKIRNSFIIFVRKINGDTIRLDYRNTYRKK